jgi:hypothetical protein
MAITRAVKPKTTESFISGAPDAKPVGVRKGTKQQITLTIAPDLLAKVDEMGQSRAALINLAIYRVVEGGV